MRGNILGINILLNLIYYYVGCCASLLLLLLLLRLQRYYSTIRAFKDIFKHVLNSVIAYIGLYINMRVKVDREVGIIDYNIAITIYIALYTLLKSSPII